MAMGAGVEQRGHPTTTRSPLSADGEAWYSWRSWLSTYCSFLRGLPEPGSVPPGRSSRRQRFERGVYLCAIGVGAAKATMASFSAEQLDDDAGEGKASYFSWYYGVGNLGILTAGTLLVWVEERVSWALGFAVCAAFLAAAVLGLASTKPVYRMVPPVSRPSQCANGWSTRRSSGGGQGCGLLPVVVAEPADRSLTTAVTSEPGTRTVAVPRAASQYSGAHKAQRRLDQGSATTVPPSISSENSSERRTRPGSWRAHLVAPAASHRPSTPSPSQTKATWRSSGWYCYLDSAPAFDAVTAAEWATWRSVDSGQRGGRASTFTGELDACRLSQHSDVIYIDPVAPGYPHQVEEVKTLLRLVPIWLTAAVYFVANSQSQAQTTFVQQAITMDPTIGCGAVAISVPAASLTSVETAFAVAAYVAMAVSDAALGVGHFDFFYDQAPETMKGASTAFYFLSLSLGNLLSVQLVRLVAAVTGVAGRTAWFPPDMDDGHLDYYYLLVVGIMTLCLFASPGTTRPRGGSLQHRSRLGGVRILDRPPALLACSPKDEQQGRPASLPSSPSRRRTRTHPSDTLHGPSALRASAPCGDLANGGHSEIAARRAQLCLLL
ncbi:hypothetical protein PR202_ga19158 [Eleusine coracana subsp. coracana]|uniref:Uncharacterized protein n=1 Tax=Eleusine coracana subsp. coracana TaxID=191504 RepID=A0AAV5CVC7_ELECO|nr:hypothetical protein PR202_ga19158 [Eleusine coracana subsp. coracana]